MSSQHSVFNQTCTGNWEVMIVNPNGMSTSNDYILGSQISLSSKYLQSLHSSGILSPNCSILEHWPTNHMPITISLDQQTSRPACQSDAVQVKAIDLTLHQLTHS